MRYLIWTVALFAVVATPIAVWYARSERETEVQELVLHGNVDLRQVELAFANSERIDTVLVQEGDRIHRGQIIAKLDARRLEPPVAQARAEVLAHRSQLERLRNGNRPEEIAQARANLAAQRAAVERLKNGSRAEETAQARANVDMTKAELARTRVRFDRLFTASQKSNGQAIPQQDIDDARAAMDSADAKVAFNQKALELSIAGPRAEDIAQAEAALASLQQTLDLAVAGARKEDIAQAEEQLRGLEAQLSLLQQVLSDATLTAPVDGVVRSRLMEPGEMAAPQKPVISIAITDPKWVRAYVSEPDLGKVAQGQTATVTVDSFPQNKFEGWIGFISPVAEFTPKTVQTEELRTSLVYEVRVFVKDPSDVLRLGMPATVSVQAAAPATVVEGK